MLKMKELIKIMQDYCSESLALYKNEFVHSYLENILDSGAESSKQLEVYNEGGFEVLKKFLVDNVSYTIGE